MLADELAQLIESDVVPTRNQLADLDSRLIELGMANSSEVAAYWRRTEPGYPLPDVAFRGATSPYYFPEVEPARVFKTSGTSGRSRGTAAYTQRGLELMRLAILRSAREYLLGTLQRPAIIRLVPAEAAAPEMIIAHGMELISNTYGDPELSDAPVSSNGLDMPRFVAAVERAIAAKRPILFIGGTFVYVNICDALRERGIHFEAPEGSRAMDAGGFKGRSRIVDVDTLRQNIAETLGVKPSECLNLFGMTELASQLYDVADVPIGPLRERPKGGTAQVEARVRAPETMQVQREGLGLLEVIDWAICDRPHHVLTGDLAVACEQGVAIVGRAIQQDARGCSLSLDALTQGGPG